MIGTLITCSLVIITAYSGWDLFVYFTKRE